jgi:hypothetical protein
MVRLAGMIERALAEWRGKPAGLLLDSDDWLAIELRCKDVVTDLELKGLDATARRVDRERDMLTTALIALDEEGRAVEPKSDRTLWKAVRSFGSTLLSLGGYREEIERQAGKRKTATGKGSRGPDRMSLDEAWEYLTTVQGWYTVQQRNKPRRLDNRIRKVQFAEQEGITVADLNARLAWYRKYRAQKAFPGDPRTVSKGELEKLFA